MERINEKGTMKINKSIFGRLVYDAVGLTEGRACSSSEKGKQLTGIGGSRPTAGEITDNMIIREQDGKLNLELYIIISFGSSIQKVTDQILDHMEKELKPMFPNQPVCLTLKVTGVKSKQIAPRNIEVVRQWD